MAHAKTLTTADGGGFVFLPAEPHRRFPNRLIRISWLTHSGRSNRYEHPGAWLFGNFKNFYHQARPHSTLEVS